MKKEKYTAPLAEMIDVTAEDIITTSKGFSTKLNEKGGSISLGEGDMDAMVNEGGAIMLH